MSGKKHYVFKFGVICVCIFLMATLFCSCYRVREKKYYSEKSNYITDVAIVDNIIYNEEDNCIVFWLSEIDESYASPNFVIRGENTTVVLDNGILEKIQLGSEITYISAPGMYSNGYAMPIVAISVNDEEILGFEEGYANLLKWLD